MNKDIAIAIGSFLAFLGMLFGFAAYLETLSLECVQTYSHVVHLSAADIKLLCK